MTDYIDDVFGEEGILSRRFPGYKPRLGQVSLARAIDDAIRNGQHLIAEAPTGVGKSVSYSVPAIYHAVTSRAANETPPDRSHCLACGRQLEDDGSREIGLGPACREQFGLASVESEKAKNAQRCALETLGAYCQGDVTAVAAADRLHVLGFTLLAMRLRDRRQGQPSPPNPAVIVTANIALQEQLARKDLPMLQEILPWPFKFALVKGMSNYLCEYKLEQEKQASALPQIDDQYRALMEWAEITTTGDVSELPFEPPSKLWSCFSISTDDCLADACEFKKTCHPLAARRRAREADIIVTNYHLFFADLRVRKVSQRGLLPNYHVVIFDEGHKAVDIARDFFGFRVTPGQIRWLASMLPTRLKVELDREQRAFFDALGKHAKSPEYKARIRTVQPVPSANLERMLEEVELHYGARIKETDLKLSALLSELEEAISEQLEKAEIDRLVKMIAAEKKQRKKFEQREYRAIDLRYNVRKAMAVYVMPDQWFLHPAAKQGTTPETRWWCDGKSLLSEDKVRTVEDVFFIEEDDGAFALCSKPISVESILRRGVFIPKRAAVVTSATLMTNGSFDFIAKDMGVERPQTLVAQSPFNWPEQCLLIIPADVPEPDDKRVNFKQVAAEKCAQVIELARGRTLGLFTSHAGLNAAYDRCKRTGYRILKQGDMPRTKLIDEFRRDVDSVLLGTESFWAGVDVQGESLSAVFIDKLPFVPPDDPLLDALQERDPKCFMRFSIPRAIISLKQGFGRLVRTTTDRGVVVVLDRRIYTKRYGSMFLDSLPQVLKSSSIEDVRRFLDREPLVGLPQLPSYSSAGKSLLDG